MIIIANFGRYLNEITKKFKSRCDKSVASSLRRASLHHRIEENRKPSVSKGNDEPSIESIVYLPITFAYVCVGLAITTIAIDVGSEYLKKLQNIGKRVKNVASVRIWFGGKTLKVRELLHAVGGKCGVESGVIDKLDLDNIVEIAIAINEGREPPNDNNAIQDPCPPYSPRLDPIFPNIETISIASWDEAPLLSIHSFQKFWETLQATDVCETPKFSAEKYSVDPNEPIIYPLNHPEPVNEPSTSEPEPKQFQAKKERYKRDPKKLFEIYQQEWNRIDRLKANKKQENPETKRKNSSQ
uniref:Uncharacterized protein n=1 Tax=Acrobeloides nanus TaxID=290746 RepID=A0A914D0M1_9BILA